MTVTESAVQPGTVVPGPPTYRPAQDPELLRGGDPVVARAALRDVLGYLDEHGDSVPPAEQRAFGRRVGIASGLYACQFPVEVGGYGVSEIVAAELREQTAATGAQWSRCILSSQEGPTRVLLSGTAEQRERWLRPLVQGRLTRCLAMTEEGGGSDLTRVTSTATRDRGHWVLHGGKYMISNAAESDVAVVLAQAAGDAGSGLTFFVIDTHSPGWRIVRRMPGMDPFANQYEVAFDGIELTDDAVVGGLDRIGGAAGMASEYLPYGRLCLAARAVGYARRALEIARRHADGRQVFGVRLSDKQFVREYLVRSDVRVTAAREMVRIAARALDEDRLAVREAAMAKLVATDAACAVIDDAMQVLGGRGWLTEFGLEQLYREARLLRIVDGTSEMLKETIFHLAPLGARV